MRLAALHERDQGRAGRSRRTTPSALRDAVQTGVLALPEEQRARLQELSGRAVRKSLLLP